MHQPHANRKSAACPTWLPQHDRKEGIRSGERWSIVYVPPVLFAGPHVMEVVVKEAQLQWPYLLQMGFLWDVMAVYCTCVFVPWVPTLHKARPLAPYCLRTP